MRLRLVFSPDGNIHGEGVDDVGAFTIGGLFNGATSEANWTKAYVGRHKVQYSGIYSQRTICGDWTLTRVTGGFWIWPGTDTESEKAATQTDQEVPVEPVPSGSISR
jgi:hypothetical protein